MMRRALAATVFAALVVVAALVARNRAQAAHELPVRVDALARGVSARIELYLWHELDPADARYVERGESSRKPLARSAVPAPMAQGYTMRTYWPASPGERLQSVVRDDLASFDDAAVELRAATKPLNARRMEVVVSYVAAARELLRSAGASHSSLETAMAACRDYVSAVDRRYPDPAIARARAVSAIDDLRAAEETLRQSVRRFAAARAGAGAVLPARSLVDESLLAQFDAKTIAEFNQAARIIESR
jgi:hypothetical protein